jgi:lysophospholipid acyltransferase (LPLAT)-like uncharacterized protein
MKNFSKKIVRRLPGKPFTWVLYVIIRALYASMRIRVIGADIPRYFQLRDKGVINIFWHGRILLAAPIYTGKGLHILISRHGDGEIIANIMKLFGFFLVRGSSSKGGKEAFREMVRLARENKELAITPDGPRGPFEEVKLGVAQVARITGCPVIPLGFYASPCWRLRSWDRFLLPYPFSRGVFVWGEPLFYAEGEEMEAFRLRIEHALKDANARAEGYFRT